MSQHNALSEEKIHIYLIIKKSVSYGQAVYAVGNISHLGNWNIENCLRLNWSKVTNILCRMIIGLDIRQY